MPDGDLRHPEDAAWRVLGLGAGQRHLPGQHNQESHGNDVVADVVKNPLDKLGLAKRIDLKPGEKLLSSRRLHSDPDSGTFDLLSAEIDTPSGRQVRLGIVYHDDAKHWAAGPDPKRARRKAELDEQIARIEDGEEDADDDLYEQLLEERSDLGEVDELSRTVVLDPAAVGQLRAQLESGAEKGRAFEKEFNAFWDSEKGRELTELIDELEATLAPIRRKPSFARTPDERKQVEAVSAQQAELYRRYNAPESDPMLLKGSVPGGDEGDLHYLVEGNDDGEGGWRISLGVKPPDADENWHIGIDDDEVRIAGGDVKKLLKALAESESGTAGSKASRAEVVDLATGQVRTTEVGMKSAEDGQEHRLPAASRRRSRGRHPTRSRNVGLCTRAFDFELDGPGDGRTLEGYAAVFNSPARIRDLQGDFDEVILPGAFTRSLQRRMPVLQWDHGKDPSVGTAPIGDIEEVREDDHGLYVRARLYDSPSIERVRLAIKGKSVRGMSFRFGVPGGGDKWSHRSGDVDLREIGEADTHELGPVVFPAYDATSVSVRSILSNLDASEMRELVHELAEYLNGAVDLSDFTGRPGTRGAGGGDLDLQPSSGGRSISPEILRLDAEAFRALGVL